MDRQLFGLPAYHADDVLRIRAGSTALFLFNIQKRMLMGVCSEHPAARSADNLLLPCCFVAAAARAVCFTEPLLLEPTAAAAACPLPEHKLNCDTDCCSRYSRQSLMARWIFVRMPGTADFQPKYTYSASSATLPNLLPLPQPLS